MALLNLRSTLAGVRHVDHHAHSILREPPADLDGFRSLFSASADPRQWPHVTTTVTYLRAISVVAGHLGCEAGEAAVFDRRVRTEPAEYAADLLMAAGAETVLVDEGYPPSDTALSTAELGQLTGCQARPILRLETLAVSDDGHLIADSLARVADARADGYVALKTILAYRGGLDLAAVEPATAARLHTALEVNRDSGHPLPVQIHTGFGDADLLLPRTDPGHLQPLFGRFPETSFVLLHCYPYVRQAGWLAAVYANVFFDLSLTIPHVSRPAAVLAEAIELAPLSKLLYASDAVRTPELYLLAAVWWRDALAEVLGGLLPSAAAEHGARLILHDNAAELYRV